MDKFVWSQSALKDFEREDNCPKRWNAVWINKEWKPAPNEHMLRGSYFEFLCIGKNAKGDLVKDLPRLKSGDKSVTQRRIEEQAEYFKKLFDPKSDIFTGWVIESVQVTVKGNIMGIPAAGDIDVILKNLETRERRIGDIKLAEDIYSDREYGWGRPVVDWDCIQQITYAELYKQYYKDKLNTTMLLFEHGPKQRSRIVDLDFSEETIEINLDRFSIAENHKLLYSNRGWIVWPSENECKSCKLTCDARKNIDDKLENNEEVDKSLNPKTSFERISL